METYPKLFAKCPGKQNVWLEVRRVQVVTVPLLVIGASLFHKPDGYAHSQAHAAPWNSLGRGADYVHCLQIATRGRAVTSTWPRASIERCKPDPSLGPESWARTEKTEMAQQRER